MELWKRKINGRDIEFVNTSRSTRHGFAHDTVLFIDGYQEVKNTAHYINRTWECYRYQTVMLGAVNILINRAEENIERIFKADNGYKKLTPARRTELNKRISESDYIKFLYAIKNELNER